MSPMTPDKQCSRQAGRWRSSGLRGNNGGAAVPAVVWGSESAAGMLQGAPRPGGIACSFGWRWPVLKCTAG